MALSASSPQRNHTLPDNNNTNNNRARDKPLPDNNNNNNNNNTRGWAPARPFSRTFFLVRTNYDYYHLTTYYYYYYY